MIDLESPLFSLIATELRSAYTGIFVTGEYVPVPASFPAVSIMEMDNATMPSTWSNRPIAQYAQVMYEVNVYSNRENGKKAESRAIMSTIDDLFQQYGFERMFCQPIPNMNEATIYRITARYRAIVSDDLTIYRR